LWIDNGWIVDKKHADSDLPHTGFELVLHYHPQCPRTVRQDMECNIKRKEQGGAKIVRYQEEGWRGAKR
jgi:hypothetical protein